MKLLFSLLLLLGACVLRGQNVSVFKGIVTDATTGIPVVSAEILDSYEAICIA
jgi:hypothetical protein